MPKSLERKLKKQYGMKSDMPYKIMNKMGMMKGSKMTESKSKKTKGRKKYIAIKRGKKYA